MSSNVTENVRHHEEGLRLFLAGRAADSVAFFEAALKEQESSIRWNDWATAVLACGHSTEAEQGYRRALALDPENGQASVNLGVMLMRQKRISEAVPFLEQGRASVPAQERQLLDNLLESCGAQPAPAPQSPAKSLLAAYGHRGLAEIFSDSTPVQITDPSLSWLKPPSPQFLAYAREHERLPFDDIPPDEANYLKPPTFRIAQAHRIWLTLETLRRHMDTQTTILDLGAFPFTIDLAIREFLESSCPILASLNQPIPEDWHQRLGKQDIRLTWTNLDPLVAPNKSNESISQMGDTIQTGDCTVGTVIFAHVIEHLYQPLQILKEAWRVLTPGGKILLSTDNTFMAQALLTFLSLGEYLHEPVQGTAAMSFHAWRGHVRFFSARDLQTLIEAAGFEVVETQFEEVIYNSFVDEYFRNPTRSIPRWRADLLTLCAGYRNEIIMVGRKP